MKPLNKLTRAWFEGYLEGRLQDARLPKNPHPAGADNNDWRAGYERGLAVKHYTEETKSDRAPVNDEVLRIRRALGERV